MKHLGGLLWTASAGKEVEIHLIDVWKHGEIVQGWFGEHADSFVEGTSFVAQFAQGLNFHKVEMGGGGGHKQKGNGLCVPSSLLSIFLFSCANLRQIVAMSQ